MGTNAPATKISDYVDSKGLKRYLEKQYGKRCPKYMLTCTVCEIWRSYDTIKSLIDFDDVLSKIPPIENHKK